MTLAGNTHHVNHTKAGIFFDILDVLEGRFFGHFVRNDLDEGIYDC